MKNDAHPPAMHPMRMKPRMLVEKKVFRERCTGFIR